jgi:hypothetical protein
MVAKKIVPETMGRIEEAVRELAEMEYPRVWVGEAGTTPDEALADELYKLAERKRAWEESRPEEREELWAELPEDERGGYDHPPTSWDDLPDNLKQNIRSEWELAVPGEPMEVEGEISFTFEAPDISVNWVDGLSVYETGLYRHIDPDVNAHLSEAVRVIYHAKHGRVPVRESWNIEFKEIGELDVEGGDIGVAKAVTPDGKVLVPVTPNYRYVRVEDLTSEDVDDDLLYYLECYSMEGPYAMGQFVIEDTPEAQAAVERRLEGR